MKSEEINFKAKQLLSGAKDLTQTLSDFGETYRLKLIEDLKQTLAKEMERTAICIINEAIRIMNEVKKEQTGYKKIWVCSYKHLCTRSAHGVQNSIFFDTIDEKKLEDKMSKDQTSKYLPLEEFEGKVNELKKSVLEGKLDDRLRNSAALIIHETIMLQSSGQNLCCDRSPIRNTFQWFDHQILTKSLLSNVFGHSKGLKSTASDHLCDLESGSLNIRLQVGTRD